MTDQTEFFDLVDADAPEPSASERRHYRLMDAVAERIASLARDRELSQTALADKLGKSKSYVSRVFAGGVNLTLRTIAEFEAALDAEVLTFPTSAPEYPAPRRGVPFAQVKEEWAAAQEASSVEAARLAALEAREEAVRQRELAVAAREKACRRDAEALSQRETSLPVASAWPRSEWHLMQGWLDACSPSAWGSATVALRTHYACEVAHRTPRLLQSAAAASVEPRQEEWGRGPVSAVVYLLNALRSPLHRSPAQPAAVEVVQLKDNVHLGLVNYAWEGSGEPFEVTLHESKAKPVFRSRRRPHAPQAEVAYDEAIYA